MVLKILKDGKLLKDSFSIFLEFELVDERKKFFLEKR